MAKKERMRIERINNGIVIDHIDAGKGIDILKLFPTEFLKTKIDYASYIDSPRMGMKDIIKIENLDVNAEWLMRIALLAPDLTISIIRNAKVQKKVKPTIPEIVEGILKCRNPKCVTIRETYLVSRFRVGRTETGRLKQQCTFCEHIFYD
ncbi:Aspartate carbamoyltransferase regulatory chain [Sulfidibacter corallicola]|uniref:Aspartate carbamoyltransferase regulatory subunit n=1 Tax=Sulfidibacter corallicola TaxID=2818388 RepID=A0A8A4TWX5_SULCO|nr:aspartate carbamoyltransferase regulatory subunit [Sulfidibacter corallicola]QTD53847.1 aspartate carbamoyltransferase regulatory subunit [Sulfidibacter corallicola]